MQSAHPSASSVPRMAISMMQPYAWLFVNGILRIDDRTWNTSYRGPLWIHASTSLHQELYDSLRASTSIEIPPLERFKKGGLVGRVDLIDVVPPGSTQYPSKIRAHGGPGGYYGFVFANPLKIPFEKMRGRPGLFKVARLPSGQIYP